MYVLHCKHYCSSDRADVRCVWCLPQQIWPSSFLVLFLLHCFFFSLFSLFSSLSFPFSFLFLFPDWMNLCSVLFLPLCLSHNTPGQGWSILYITSVTQRGTVTSTKSFILCMVTWREWTMHDLFCLIFIFEACITFFPSHTKQNTGGMRLFLLFFPWLFCPNLLSEVLMFLFITSSVGCDCCGCVRSVFALMELQCLLVCSERPTASLSLLPEILSKQSSVCAGEPGFKHLKHTHKQRISP